MEGVLPGPPLSVSLPQGPGPRAAPRREAGRTNGRVRRAVDHIRGLPGRFGLAAHAAERRTREIGVRKFHGASVSRLVALLSTDFLKLVGMAFIVATPVAYLGMRRWLADFAYRIEIGAGVFLLTGALFVIIALVAVSYQLIRATMANPVNSLRTE